MSPTQRIWRDAGREDGLAGAKVVGNTDTYLRGYAEGELRRHVKEKYATLTEEHLHTLCGQYNLDHEGLDHDQTLDLITDHLAGVPA